jgi:hypothetical protein
VVIGGTNTVVMVRNLLVALFVGSCGSASPVATTPLPNAPIPVQPPAATPAAPKSQKVATTAIADAKQKLLAKYGDQRERIDRGVDQVAALWRTTDGDFVAFCVEQFAANDDLLFARMEALTEQIRGHNNEIGRAARWGSEVDTGPMQPFEGLLASYDPRTHVTDDLFTSKIAFAVLLNFPLTTLADRIRDGANYSRRQWAEVRLASQFDARVPSELEGVASAADAAAEAYIAGYNMWMHHILAEDGKRLFPSGKRLISHWNLRDELKANYADKDGLAKQRTIAKVMERIATQSIPKAVIDNPHLDWDPFTNEVTVAQEVEADAPKDRATTPSDAHEPDTRFEHVLAHFRAARAIDAYSPISPTYIERAFVDAEMPEARVRAMLVEILEAPEGAQVAQEIQAKLGRKLEPHDLWFPIAIASTAEAELDAVTRKKYPSAAAFAKDVPRILHDLGFTTERAKYLSEHIEVDPSRGAGHAMEAERRGDKAHLRTRVEAQGMDYKGYNIAVHELGHNIEQTFSLYDIDHTLLQGVPNIAFTEALAFLFQARDRELLGRPRPHGEADRLRVLDAFWQTREIAGSALVEIDVWHWLYEHPNATAAQLREATDAAARAVWNRYYAPILGGNDTALLAIYSHTIASPLYLFNYVLGHLIAFQVEQHLDGKDKATFGKEFERVARLGKISPDLWMVQATGKPVGTESLLGATKAALAARSTAH